MLMRWFNKMDADRDGELQAGELREFIGAQLGTADFNTGRKMDHAIQQVTSNSSGQTPIRQTYTIPMHMYLFCKLQVPSPSAAVPEYTPSVTCSLLTGVRP
jgi:hypothetical protein